ncbi:RES domain-containing protein [Mesorhizobium sp. ISC25]|uniref:RES family NAD+ phosphorylase n=1 Tax=Mesorhizobium sp. ISC25 TaxID=3077335 RepID=UPI0035E1015E
MKISRVGPDEIFHRYLTPKWAFLPTSGAGAASDSGRFNWPGVEALYLSRAPQTALEEYKQGASITPPATLAAYKITLTEVVDLSQGFDPHIWSSDWKEWDCAWRQIARIDRKIPSSWKLASSDHRWVSWHPVSVAASCWGNQFGGVSRQSRRRRLCERPRSR